MEDVRWAVVCICTRCGGFDEVAVLALDEEQALEVAAGSVSVCCMADLDIVGAEVRPAAV